jgi:hypothetical protein
MRIVSLAFGMLLLGFGLAIIYVVATVQSDVSQVPLSGGKASSLVGGGWIPGIATCLAGLIFTVYGLGTPPTRLTIDDIKELGLASSSSSSVQTASSVQHPPAPPHVEKDSPPPPAAPSPPSPPPRKQLPEGMAPVDVDILRLMSKGWSISKIASVAGMDREAVLNRARILVRDGYVTPESRLTAKGHDLVREASKRAVAK